MCAWLAEPLRTLESAYTSQRLGHAWLLTGPAGVGKLNLALVFADRLLHGRAGTELPPELTAAGACEAMLQAHDPADHHPDLHWIYPAQDKRTIAVEQIRDVTDSLELKAFRGRFKVVVIEPAEAMTAGAANALLKSLEEPAAGTYLLLISHQPGRLPATIRSRCQTLLVRAPRAAGALALPPLLIAQRAEEGYTSLIKELNEQFDQLLEYRADPRALAEEWLKRDAAGVLDWLVGRIRSAIRARVAAQGSTDVTDARAAGLHNAGGKLTLSALFEQLRAAERIRGQLGSGLNNELALHVLLLGFIPERGRS